MLCFVFAALVVLLDQLFKQYIIMTLVLHEKSVLIPGIIGLTHIENPGASFGIFSNYPWVLVGIAVLAVILLAMILLRYNDGFWGTLGLAAVLGGAMGNLIDRMRLSEFEGSLVPGGVVDMFELHFMEFAIFNIADIFITLGGLTFIIFFIVTTVRQSRGDVSSSEPATAEYVRVGKEQPEEQIGLYDFRFEEGTPEKDEYGYANSSDTIHIPSVFDEPAYEPPPDYPEDEQPVYFEEPLEDTSPMLDAPGEFESELTASEYLEDYDVEQLLRDYGFENEEE